MVRLLLTAALLLATAACGPKYQPQSVHVADPGPPQRVLPGIRVVDPGMTPRAPLRYRVPPGHTELLFVEIAQAEVVRAEGKGEEAGMPPIQIEVKMGPAEPTPQGLVRHPVQITQVRISEMAEQMSPAQREQLEKTLAPLLEVQGWSEMDIQGRIRRGEFSGMEDVSPRLRTMLGNIRSALLTIPFPDEPLGPRARWEVERKLQFSGVWVDQVATYEIEKMDRDQLTLQITARQSAPTQTMASGRLEAYQASMIGSAVVRLDKFTPTSEAEATAQMRISTQTQAGPELVQVDERTMVKLYPADQAKESGRPGAKKSNEPDENAPPPADPSVLIDPGKQKLKW